MIGQAQRRFGRPLGAGVALVLACVCASPAWSGHDPDEATPRYSGGCSGREAETEASLRELVQLLTGRNGVMAVGDRLRCAVHAHPDLAKKFGYRPKGDLRRYYEPAIQAAVDTQAAFEINTAGRYKKIEEFYPTTEFLELMADANLPVLLSSDAHEPGHVARDFEEAQALAKTVGLKTTLRFEKREKQELGLGD